MTDTIPPLLRIDTSARIENSVSRRLADGIQASWQARFPQGFVRRRDLASHPLPHIAADTIQGFYTPHDQLTPTLRTATALSDELIAELKSAHTVLISAPIYNFSVPSALKAWIDQIVRIGETFSYDGKQFSGLVTQPQAVLALAYGAGGYQGPLASMDHLRPYLTSLLGFLGITKVTVVAAEATTADSATVTQKVEAALRDAAALFTA